MIFVSVGMQMPFDRMCKAVDEWAGTSGRKDVFMQIGETDWKPVHCEYENMISPPKFREKIEEASVLVMHAGIGSIVTGIECGIPMILMPRFARLRETRNEHQTATLKRMEHLQGLTAAWDEHEMIRCLEQFDFTMKPKPMSPDASPELMRKIRQFIEEA